MTIIAIIIKIIVQCSEFDKLMVYADKNRIRTVIENLIANATEISNSKTIQIVIKINPQTISTNGS